MRALLERARRIAESALPFLILGERGTGKGVLARWMHAISPRASGPFVHSYITNMTSNLEQSELFGHVRGAFTGATGPRTGRVEAAHGGLLPLDEIGDASPEVQGMLLEVLEHRRVTRIGETLPRTIDVQLAAATNRDLEALAERGSFRRDLLDRFGYLRLTVPPLRKRRDEIVPLALRFLADITIREDRTDAPRLSPRLAELLAVAPWPGNVRQLRAVCEHLAVMARSPDVVDVPDLPPEFLAEVEGRSVERDREKLTRAEALEALAAAGGNKAAAARKLRISRPYLYRVLEREA